MIPVTKTFLPPIEEYQQILQRSWHKGWITNRGELVQELEFKLKSFLGVKNIVAMTNGTLPLQIGMKALNLKNEIITTPFSYVATTSSIIWESCKPVFVDIHPDYLTIDESKIEDAITNQTSGILATHVYGNPCDIEAIEFIARKYNLKIIYDAAHCFGVKYKEKSVFNYGDLSTCSFHATKIFHTGEGGAVFCNNNLYERVFSHHNFGHDGPDNFSHIGINAKMSELQAAMGLSVLPYFEMILRERKKVCDLYRINLKSTKLKLLKIRKHTKWNYSYFPVIFPSKNDREAIIILLNKSNIYPRKYFSPSLNNLKYLNKRVKMPVSESIADRVICLPLYVGLEEEIIMNIISIINNYKFI